MRDCRKQTIILDDLSIDILYNPIINNKPYLIRIYSYDCCSEHRVNSADLLKFNSALTDFVVDKSDEVCYNDSQITLRGQND